MSGGMDALYLTEPSRALERDIWDYRSEHFAHGETHINGSGGLAECDSFERWLEQILSFRRDALTEDGIHASTFFAVRRRDGQIIGSVQLRHTLTPDLALHAGHIGYGIRPTERRKGYGTQQLRLILDVARDMLLPRVMLTCDTANLASRRTILSCGGVLTRENVYEGEPQCIYWIDL